MTNNKKLEWILRIGVFGEFFGHGMLAIGGKQDWVHWISQLTGINTPLAHNMLIVIGVFDVMVSGIVLLKPAHFKHMSSILLWAAFWGFWTALVRPLVGIGWLDFIERFANVAAPLALYYFYKEDKEKNS